VRGTGVFWAVELVTDRETRTPAPAPVVGALKAACLARGLLPFVAENRVHVVPPCVVTPDEARRGLAILDEALTEVTAAR